MSPTAAIISTHSLSKSYNGTRALDELTLEIPEGSIGLLGENGAGKTTLIKLLLGLLHPTSGSARVFEFDVDEQGLELRRRVGYMPEDECLPPDLSAFDLVVRMGQLSGLPREAAVQRCEAATRGEAAPLHGPGAPPGLGCRNDPCTSCHI